MRTLRRNAITLYFAPQVYAASSYEPTVTVGTAVAFKGNVFPVETRSYINEYGAIQFGEIKIIVSSGYVAPNVGDVLWVYDSVFSSPDYVVYGVVRELNSLSILARRAKMNEN